MAKVLGARLGALVAAHPQVARQAHAAARQAVASFQRESAVARTDFSRPYEEAKHARPLGEEPILVTKVGVATADDGTHRVTFAPAKGQEITLNLNAQYLHSFCHVLASAARRADWDLNLELRPAISPQAAAPERLM